MTYDLSTMWLNSTMLPITVRSNANTLCSTSIVYANDPHWIPRENDKCYGLRDHRLSFDPSAFLRQFHEEPRLTASSWIVARRWRDARFSIIQEIISFSMTEIDRCRWFLSVGQCKWERIDVLSDGDRCITADHLIFSKERRKIEPRSRARLKEFPEHQSIETVVFFRWRKILFPSTTSPLPNASTEPKDASGFIGWLINVRIESPSLFWFVYSTWWIYSSIGISISPNPLSERLDR